jgi:hypothetical protein
MLKQGERYTEFLNSPERIVEAYTKLEFDDFLQYFRHDAAHCSGNVIHYCDIITDIIDKDSLSTDELKRFLSSMKDYARWAINVVDAGIKVVKNSADDLGQETRDS